MAYAFRSALLAAAGFAVATPAMAKGKPDHAPGHAKDHAPQEQSDGVQIDISIGLGDDERRIVRDYYTSQKNCPPGLAKKNNGCLPPGIAKKRYEIGRPVFDDAIIVELPHDVVLRLPPLRSGYGYRLVDGDLVIVALSTMVVLDAIGLI